MMNGIDLSSPITFKLTDESVKKIDELNKEQLEEAKKLIEEALENLKPKKGFKQFMKLNKCFVVGFYDEETSIKELEKAKAWKRLKDKGFKFDGWTIDDGLRISICTNFDGGNIYSESEKEIRTILDLLFGGEE